MPSEQSFDKFITRLAERIHLGSKIPPTPLYQRGARGDFTSVIEKIFFNRQLKTLSARCAKVFQK